MINTNEYKNLIGVLTNIGKYATSKYKESLKNGDSYASGKLFNSIDYRIDITNNGCKLMFLAEKYYLVIENGRKAGGKMPPIAVIERWMKQKGITPRKGQTLSGVAYTIARSIKKKGIRPKPYLNNVKKSLKDYEDDIREALKNDLGSIISNKLQIKFAQVKQNKYIQIKHK